MACGMRSSGRPTGRQTMTSPDRAHGRANDWETVGPGRRSTARPRGGFVFRIYVRGCAADEAALLQFELGRAPDVVRFVSRRYSWDDLVALQRRIRALAETRPDADRLSASALDVRENAVYLYLSPGGEDLLTAIRSVVEADAINVEWATVVLTQDVEQEDARSPDGLARVASPLEDVRGRGGSQAVNRTDERGPLSMKRPRVRRRYRSGSTEPQMS